MTVTRFCRAAAAVLVLGAAAAPAQAQVWTDWTDLVFGTAGAGTGTLTFGSEVVGVEYTGQVESPSQIACGTAWFGSPAFPAYTGVVAPPPPCDMIAIRGAPAPGSLHTLVFSRPVVDPFFAIVSLGQPSFPVRYAFSAPFSIIDQGAGFWGSGPLTDVGDNTLEGREGHGIIQFNGTFTSLSWNASPTEFWHGFTVGAPRTSVTPEPFSVVLLGTGLAGLGVIARRRRRTARED